MPVGCQGTRSIPPRDRRAQLSPVSQDVAAGCGLQRQERVLFDEQDRGSFRVDLADDLEDRIAPGSAPVRATARRGAAPSAALISARPMATICCSPPLRLPASCERARASAGNSVKTRSRSVADAGSIAARVRAHVEVLADGHAREEPASLGRVTHAEPRNVGRPACPRCSCRNSCTSPARGRDEPADGAQRRRLAGAVAADERDDLALADLEADTPCSALTRP